MGKSHFMLRRFFVWLGCSGVLLGSALAQWDIHRFEGRDYVTLENVAAFYGLPKPPPNEPLIVLGPLAPDAKFTGDVIISPGKKVLLEGKSAQLEIAPKSREVLINGVKQWLAFPAHTEGSHILISRLDVAKTLEPRFRPEMIPGLQPVKTVVLDAGHGGHDRGAISRYGFEKDFALDVALRARKLLEEQGYKVVMTRSSDIFIPLHERPAIANRVPNSIFVSVHFNSSSSNADARGFEIFSIAPRGAPATNEGFLTARELREEPGNAVDLPSAALAGSVFHAMLGRVPMIDRGLKHARFAVLRLCTVPAVLVECGFVSNNAESALISSSAWRTKVAEAIVTGVEGYKTLAEKKQAPKVLAEYRRAASSGVGLRDASGN